MNISLVIKKAHNRGLFNYYMEAEFYLIPLKTEVPAPNTLFSP